MWSDWQQKIFSDSLLASWLDKDSGLDDIYDMLRTFLTIGSKSCAFCWQLTVTVVVVYNRRELTYWKKKITKLCSVWIIVPCCKSFRNWQERYWLKLALYRRNLFFYSFLDTDECSSSVTNECDPNSLCTNTEGSYICRCLRGFQGDGLRCEGTKTHFYQLLTFWKLCSSRRVQAVTIPTMTGLFSLKCLKVPAS